MPYDIIEAINQAALKQEAQTQEANFALRNAAYGAARKSLQGALEEFYINLADLTTEGKLYSLSGFALVCAVFGSDNVAVDVSIGAGSNYVLMQPGMKYKTSFTQLLVKLPAGSPASGRLRVVIVKQPDSDYEEMTVQSASAVNRVPITPAAVNVTTNRPTLSTQGVPLAGSRGVRALVQADVGQTITGGTVVWHLFDEVSGLWHESPVQIALPTATRAVCTPDEFVNVGSGRAFPELRSVTVSGGALTCFAVEN